MTDQICTTTLTADQQRDLLPIRVQLDGAPYNNLTTIAQVFWMSDDSVILRVRVITRAQAERIFAITQEATP
jgi:hypothetical protein